MGDKSVIHKFQEVLDEMGENDNINDSTYIHMSNKLMQWYNDDDKTNISLLKHRYKIMVDRLFEKTNKIKQLNNTVYHMQTWTITLICIITIIYVLLLRYYIS